MKSGILFLLVMFSLSSQNNIFPDLLVDEYCNAEDSIYIGMDYYIYLSDQELMRLGFQNSANYCCYFHTRGHDSSYYSIETRDSFTIAELSEIIKNIRKTDLPFYIHSSTDINDRTDHSFELINDTLVPVLFKRTNTIFNYDLNKIYWFTVHDSLFVLLPPRYLHLKEKYKIFKNLKLKNQDNDVVNYGFQPIEGVTFTTLTPEELENLGIQFRDSSVKTEFDFHWNCDELIYKSTLIKNKISIIDTLSKTDAKKNTILPPTIQPEEYVTKKLDTLNMKRSVSWDSCIYIDFITDLKGNKLKEFHYIERNTYPVHNNIPNSLFPILSEESEEIFWLITTSTFFNSLPQTIQRAIYIEWVNAVAMDAVSKNRFKSKGKYFENGKSTYEFIELSIEFKPENNKLGVKLISDDNLLLNVFLLNISGLGIKKLESRTAIEKGAFVAEYDVSDIISGLYLVYFETDKGTNIQRAVISR